MSRGESGRIVVEVDPEMKRRLYAALALTGSTLKDWFIKSAVQFCTETNQPSLFSSTSALPQAPVPVESQIPIAGQSRQAKKLGT